MRNKGFTLVEVLIAVALVAILLSTVYGVFTSVAGAKQRLEAEGEGYHRARVFFDRLGRELRGAYYDPAKASTRFIGELNEEQLPRLALTTTAGTPYGGRQGGIAVVEYELFPDRLAPVGDETRVLMRDEYPNFQPVASDREGYRLATGVGEMKVRYHKDGEWYENEYDARKNGGLPQMVEVTLSLPVEGRQVPFRTTYEIPMALGPRTGTGLGTPPSTPPGTSPGTSTGTGTTGVGVETGVAPEDDSGSRSGRTRTPRRERPAGEE